MPYGPEDDIPEDLNLDNFSPFTKAAEAARLGMLQPKTVPDTTGTMNLPEMDFSQHETQLPGMDFSDSGAPSALEDLSIPHGGLGALSETPDERLQRRASEHDEEAGGPGNPKPAPVNSQDDYLSALKRIKDNLSKPVPDFQRGYQEAAAQDASDNNFNRVLGYLSAAIRRAPTADFAPPATHAADFVRQFQGQQAADNAQTDRLEKLATITKPKVTNTPDLDAQRNYLVKLGVVDAETAKTMGPAGLKMVFDKYGLDQRKAEADAKAKADAAERQTDNERADRSLAEAARHNKQMEGAAFLAAGQKKEDVERKRVEGLPYGVTLKPDARPSEDQKKDLSKSQVEMTATNGALDEVGRLLDGMGSLDRIDPNDPRAQRVRNLVTQIQGSIKGPTMLNLGALSGPDMGMLEGLISDPTSFRAQFTPDRWRQQMDEIRNWYKRNYDARLQTIGADVTSSAETKKGADGKTYRKNSNGKWEPVG